MKIWIGFIAIACSVMLLGCSNSTFEQASNGVMNSNLERTILNYHFEDNGYSAITLYSFTETVSPITTLSLHILFNADGFNVMQYEPLHNVYFYSFLKSLYTNENHINLEMLTVDSVQYDFYVAFKIGNILNEVDFLEQLEYLYFLYAPPKNDIIDEIYYLLIQNIIGNQITRIDDVVEQYLSDLVASGTMDLSELTFLYALLNYITHFELEITNQQTLIRVYNILMDDRNQHFIIASHEVIASQYMKSLLMLMNLMDNNTLKESFFYELFEHNYRVHYPIFYEIISPRNFAFYLTLLYFSSEPISPAHHNSLLLIADEINRNFHIEEPEVAFYLAHIAHKLDLEFEIPSNPESNFDDDILMFYFYFKNHNIGLPYIEEMPEDIFIQLLYLDILSDEALIREYMAEIDILSYQNHELFPNLINRYVAISVQHGLMTDILTNQIIAYIESREHIFGYSTRYGNFSFVVSTYYTNILNMLHRGESNGLR